jgi:tripartite-type tricarboxylate transporter receptor subunit TctC
MFAPKGTPKPIIDKLNDAIVKALDDETVRKRLLELGSDIPKREGRTPEALADLVSKEIDRWTPLMRDAAAAAK